MEQALERIWRPGRPVDTRAILSGLRFGEQDCTWMSALGGTVWLGIQAPTGAGTLAVAPHRDGILGRAWGNGAQWLLDGLPDLLGARDDDGDFVAHHDIVEQARRAWPGWWVPRSRCVLHALVPTILSQKVTSAESFSAYRRLVMRYGQVAPGPAGERGLRVAPTVEQWLAIPSWQWLRAGVDAQRADTVMRALRVAGRLEECVDLTMAQAHSRMRAVPGIGRWTAAEVAQRALGDADAVSFGDFHVARDLGRQLVGRDLDDDGLAEVLQPYAGHRFRVQRLVELHGRRRERRAPRLAPRTHLPSR